MMSVSSILVLPLSTQLGLLRTKTTKQSTALGRTLASRRSLSKKSKLRYAYQRSSETAIANHKQFYPDSFLYRRGEHPYGTREYLLVRPKPTTEDANGEDGPTSETGSKTSTDGTTTESLAPSQVQILASLHANNNVVFGATMNTNVVPDDACSDPLLKPPSILDLCPILLHAALDDCSDEGEQPQALSTLHGLSAWVRQCLEGTASSTVLLDLQELANNSKDSEGIDARVQLECITAIATGIPRPGHTVVGQGTHRDGARIWEALAREFALLDYSAAIGSNDKKIALSEECLLYRLHADSCELVKIELLADTSPAYLASAGGCMARLFLQ
jgi:hypothetical protein